MNNFVSRWESAFSEGLMISTPYVLTVTATVLLFTLLIPCKVNAFDEGNSSVPQPIPKKKSQHTYHVAILIDDLGYRRKNGLRALLLPGKVSYAILPHAPHTREFVAIARQKNKDILLHQPMQAVSKNNLLGKGALYSHMSKQKFITTLESNLENVPGVIGINNHMGSLLTRDFKSMNWVMETLQYRPLFYLDSMTSPRSVAFKVATRYKIPFLRRDLFLDNVRNSSHYVEKQFDQLIKKAKQQGYAIAIGHPYTVTLEVLERRLPKLKGDSIDLVGMQKLLQLKEGNNHSVSKFSAPALRNNSHLRLYSHSSLHFPHLVK